MTAPRILATPEKVAEELKYWMAAHAVRPPIRRWRIILTAVVLGMVFVVAGIAYLTEQQVREPLQRWADSKATNIATLAIGRAVQQVLESNSGIDFVAPLANTGGATGLSYAWSDLLKLKVALTEAVVTVVESIASDTIPVPLGELTGIYLLSAAGPALRVRIIPVGAVTADLRFDFVSQGINQVLHRIYFDVQVRMRVVAPFNGTEILVREQIPVATELIQGEVPEAVINWNGSIDELRSRNLLGNPYSVAEQIP